MFGPSKPEASDLGERMLHERNQIMFERVSRLLSDGQPRTFAFGLWHMLGEDGLVSRLRRAGYKVERVDGP